MSNYTWGQQRGSQMLRTMVLSLTLLGLAAPVQAQDARSVLQALQNAFVQVAEAVKPAVVNISTTQRPRPREPREGQQRPQVPGPFPRGGPWDEFFGRHCG